MPDDVKRMKVTKLLVDSGFNSVNWKFNGLTAKAYFTKPDDLSAEFLNRLDSVISRICREYPGAKCTRVWVPESTSYNLSVKLPTFMSRKGATR